MEKRYWKLRVGAVDFPIELLRLRLAWRLWYVIVHYDQRRFSDISYIYRTVSFLNILDYKEFLTLQCIQRLREAKILYLEYKKDLETLRNNTML